MPALNPVQSELNLKSYIQDVPNFPKDGILFRDISPLLRQHFGETIKQMGGLFSNAEWANIDLIGGIESRGFILAAGLAAVYNKGFVKIRKASKLPGPLVSKSYSLEYGKDALEMQYGKGRILIVDDVLATGGTLSAAAALTVDSGHEVAGFACLINLTLLNDFIWEGHMPRTLIQYSS